MPKRKKPRPKRISKIKKLKTAFKFQISNWKLIALLLSGSLALLLYFFWDLPNPINLTRHPSPASTKLLDRNGRLLYEIFADQRRTPISLSTLPRHVIAAHLAAEDKDFYRHSGFSLTGISRAFINTFFKRNLQGGSTITQQLVKNALLTPDRTIRRKVREFTLSVLVELIYPKDQILEFYLNQVPYGGTAYGLQSAAQTYFGKNAADLSLAEAALLAGLPAAPTTYSPFGAHPELAKSRQEYVLDQMVYNKLINQEDAVVAKNSPLTYNLQPTLKAPHFSLWVKDLLVQKYGLTTVEEGGLTVTTTLDLDLQTFAQDTVATEVARLKNQKVGNGAALIIAPKTGQILAMVGSRDYFDLTTDGNVNVVLARRQPGSSIKPINYALALERKLLTASSLLTDKPTCFLSPNQKPYCPGNYDHQFHGPTQVRFALANSFNIPAVKALSLNGLADFVASASAFGITTFTSPDHYGPSLTLGGGEVTMLDLATAYVVLANAGTRVDLNPLLKVADPSGRVLEQASPLPPNTRVISAGTAFIISHILFDPGARAGTFGSSLNVKNHPEVSVKTGTTNDLRDNWTLGYTPNILVAVWVGNNDNSPMSRVASGITGASPIWNKIISRALQDSPSVFPSQPADVTGTLVCSLSGLRAEASAKEGCSPRYEYFLKGTFPPYQTDNLRRDIPIYRPSQVPATASQIADQPGEIEYQNHAVVFDALGTMLCLDCPGGYGGPDTIRLDSTGKASSKN